MLYIVGGLITLLLVGMLWSLFKVENKKRLLLLAAAFILATFSSKYVKSVTQNDLISIITGVLVIVIFYAVVFMVMNFVNRNDIR